MAYLSNSFSGSGFNIAETVSPPFIFVKASSKRSCVFVEWATLIALKGKVWQMGVLSLSTSSELPFSSVLYSVTDFTDFSEELEVVSEIWDTSLSEVEISSQFSCSSLRVLVHFQNTLYSLPS